VPRRFLFVWSAFALVISVQLSGCSVLGYVVGNELDKGRTVKLRRGEPVQVVRLEPGATLALHMADGSRVAGRYLGIDARPSAAYAERYAAWCDTASPGFRPPRIGEPIRIHGRAKKLSSRDFGGAFAGFGPGTLYLVPHGGKAETIRMDDTRELVDSAGTKVDREQLLAVADRVPVQVIARLQLGKQDEAATRARGGRPGDSLVVPARGRVERGVDLLDGSVVGIELGGPSKVYRTTLFAIGLLADASLIAFATADFGVDYDASGCSGGSVSYTGVTPMRIVPATLWLLPEARALLAAAE